MLLQPEVRIEDGRESSDESYSSSYSSDSGAADETAKQEEKAPAPNMGAASAVAGRPKPVWNKRNSWPCRQDWPGWNKMDSRPCLQDWPGWHRPYWWYYPQKEVPRQTSHAPSTDQRPGAISCLYVYVGKEANLDEVAVDLRNQAPTILFVCCGDREVAKDMAIALSKKGVDNAPRGDGGKGKGRGDKGGDGGHARASKEEFQVKFDCAQKEDLIIAGRSGIVKEVEMKECLLTPLGGWLLVAEVSFAVAVQQMLSFRVATIGLPVTRESGIAVTWQDVARFGQEVGASDCRRVRGPVVHRPSVVARGGGSQSSRAGAMCLP